MMSIDGTVLVNVSGVECWAVFDNGDLQEIGSDNGQLWADTHSFEITDAVFAAHDDAEGLARYDDNLGLQL